ncbi:ninein-like protein isoform X1 [Polypterus senegalus]|uniref:ninein-like protein isoform X1 n=1 Tax=Polypterus senegalus TaxID=55291 RepID=UPI00196237B3|nr:ninein-like protein isoform X1 [Polypterus senegalus]XP_039593961.1 ninein-like protein isoform X1 [Polypterus senegalus]
MEEDEQDRYVSQLKEVFDSCDTTGTGYLDKEELIELCQKLHLEAHLSFLLNTLLGTDHYARVNFEEFKEGFVAVLSHSLDISTSEEESSYLEPAIPEEVKPKFVKGVKRYGRKSVPDASDLDVELAMEASEPRLYKAGKSEPLVPGARRAQLKRATSLESVESLKSDEETVSNKESKQETFEAQGQMRAWACSECNGVQHDSNSQADLVGEQIRVIWEDLCGGDRGYRSRPASSMACNTICLKYLRYEEVDDLFKKLDKNRDGRVNFQEFQQELFNLSPLSTPRASTPCKPRPQRSAQQPFKEAPCRTATPPLRSPVVGLKRLSFLDDGSGCVNAEEVMSIWNEEGIQNSRTILQTLDFPVDGKLNLEELTLAFNNELLLTNNSIHQAAFLLYKKEVQFLQGQLEQSCKERDKVKADLDKAEKRSAHLAREVDDRHAAMEQIHEKKIRELEQEYREKASATKSEMDKERELLMQQVTSQSAKLEKENVCLQASDASLREQIAMATKDNGSLQKEIAELTEKLAQSEKKVSRLQKDLDHLLIEKFGNLDPHSVELFDQEERFAEIIKAYEEQCRDLRDKNDELQMELEQLRSQAQVQKSRHCSGHADGAHQDCADCRSPTDVDASEKDLANVSIEAELAVEVMKDQYQLAIQDLKIELETKVNFYERNIALLKQNIERERKDIEESFKLEISELEEQKAVLEENNAEQQRVVTALKEQLQQQASQDVGLEKRLIRERAELEQYYAKEISSLAQRLTREKEQLEAELHETRRQETEQMRKEAEDVLLKRLSEMEKQHTLKYNDLLQQLEAADRQLRRLSGQLEIEKSQWQNKEKELLEECRKEQLRKEEKLNEEQARICQSFALEKMMIEDLHKVQVMELRSTITDLEMRLQEGSTVEGFHIKDAPSCVLAKAGTEMDVLGTAPLASEALLHGEDLTCLKAEPDSTPQDDSDFLKKYKEQVEVSEQLQRQLKEKDDEAQRWSAEVQDLHQHLIRCRDEIFFLESKVTAELEAKSDSDQECQELWTRLRWLEDSLAVSEKREQILQNAAEEKEKVITKLKDDLRDQEGHLKEAARLADLHQELKSELLEKKSEIHQLCEQLEQLEQQIAAHECQIELDVGEKVDLKTKLGEMEKAIIESRKLLEEHTNFCGPLSDQLQDQEEELKELRQQSEGLAQLVECREWEAQESIHRVAKLEEEKSKLTEQLVLMEKQVADLGEGRREGEMHRVQLQLLNDENAALKSKLESLQCDIQKCEVETNKQRKQSERLKSEKDKLQQEREQLFQENTRYREEVFDISSRNLKLSSENADLSSRVESQLGAIQLLNERLGEITRQKDEEAAVARQLQESSAQLERERLQQQSAWQRERELIEEELGISREKLQRLKDCEAELSSLTIKHEWLQEDKRRLLHEIEEQKKKAEQSEKFLENVRRQVDELRSLLLVANQEKELLAQELAASQTMIEDAKNTINQLEVDVQRMQHEKRREQADDHELFELRRRCEALCSELQAARQKTEQVATSERELRQVDQECQTLRRQQSTLQSELKDTRDQLQDALTTLSLARCSHERELGELKERISASTSREEVNKVRTQLLEEQQKVKRLQESLSCQAEQAKMQMAVQQEQYEQVLRRMEEGMQDVESKLKNVREILQEKVTQLKEQLDKNARSDLLLKDLYVENSQLMKALQVTEQRQKSVEKKNFQLEEKIAALNKVLCKITPVSLTA